MMAAFFSGMKRHGGTTDRFQQAVLRAGLFAALALTGVLVVSTSAQAHDYPWCVAATRFSGDDCAYVSREQCQLSAFGRGTCIRNYAVPDPAEKPVKAKRGKRRGHSGLT